MQVFTPLSLSSMYFLLANIFPTSCSKNSAVETFGIQLFLKYSWSEIWCFKTLCANIHPSPYKCKIWPSIDALVGEDCCTFEGAKWQLLPFTHWDAPPIGNALICWVYVYLISHRGLCHVFQKKKKNRYIGPKHLLKLYISI